ncbi:MAG: flippase-like domain-containing protein [Candidatus Thiodiazotropha sp. 'RUGA']|nr:flippase-like domain-containing protein [Candidatus Thiodiazotropha sp. 'RUGA']
MSTTQSNELQQRLMRPLLWSILAAIAIYGVSVVASDFQAVTESLGKLSLIDWSIVLGLSLVNYCLRFIRWEIYLNRLQSRIPLLRSFAYYLGGFAFTTTPGKAGEAVRSLYLKRHGVSYTASLAAFFTERFTDLVAMVLLALVAAITFPEYQWLVIVITVFILAMLPFIHARSFHALINRYLHKLSSERLHNFGLKVLDLLVSASTLLRSGPLYAGLGLGLVAWAAEGVAFYVILQSLEIETSVEMAVGIYSVSVLAGAISFIPGGLGGTEAVMVLLLTLIGADTSAAIAATLICRLATLWFAVLIGGIIIGSLELIDKDKNLQPPDVEN